MSETKKRRPWIGGLGLFLTVFGFLLMVLFDFGGVFVAVFLLGVVLMIYALVTGQTKFLG